MEYTAVIGANYGDEGKGRLVNYLSDNKTSVIRYSGSAQAAHTVVDNGRRHVFKHFGSGTLRGASTFLSDGFLSHPIMYCEELAKLYPLATEDENMVDSLDVDEMSPVVLPTDMIINQARETMRSGDRHGSCGMGVRQCLERDHIGALRVNVADLELMTENGKLIDLMRRHMEVWCTMNSMDVSTVVSLAGVRDYEGVLCRFEQTAREFYQNVGIVEETRDGQSISDTLDWADRWIFEGSQGLALDPGCGPLPHLTPTHVGVGGLVGFASSYQSIWVPELELMYATRPYLTRHGAGPLPLEGHWSIPVVDETNQRNDWQGSLRFAPLNFQDMYLRIREDLKWACLFPEKPKLTFSLGVTCLDQVEKEDFPFTDLNGEAQVGLSDFLNECSHLIDLLVSDHGVDGRAGRLITCYGEEPVDTHDSGEAYVAQVA